MESCEKPVKITIGGKEWYYQTFYSAPCVVSCVRLYDAHGEFVREFPKLDKLTVWLKRSTDRQRERELKKVLENWSKEEKKQGGDARDAYISKEEKAKTHAVFMSRVSELRGEMSMAEYAKKLGMSSGVVYAYCSGRRVPTVYAVKRIADRCGVSIDWLLGLD